MGKEFTDVDLETRALDDLLSQDDDKPRIESLVVALAAGATQMDALFADLVVDRQFVGDVDPPTVLSLGPVALYRAAYVNESAGAMVNWPDSTLTVANTAAIVGAGAGPNYEASYAAFGGQPAVTFLGADYFATVASFEADGLTLIAGFVSTAVTGNYDVVVSLAWTGSAFIGRNSSTANAFIAGVYQDLSPGILLAAVDGLPHVIALRRKINADGTATETAWLDGVKIGSATVSAATTTAQNIHIGGSVADGDPLTGAIGCIAYFDRALTDTEIGGAMQDVWSNDLGQTSDLSPAVGALLDQWGGIVGQPRGALPSDDVYRGFIAARPAANRSTGTRDELIEIAQIASGVTVHQFDTPPASYIVEWFPPTPFDSATKNELRRIMEDARPMGIGATYVEAFETGTLIIDSAVVGERVDEGDVGGSI